MLINRGNWFYSLTKDTPVTGDPYDRSVNVHETTVEGDDGVPGEAQPPVRVILM